MNHRHARGSAALQKEAAGRERPAGRDGEREQKAASHHQQSAPTLACLLPAMCTINGPTANVLASSAYVYVPAKRIADIRMSSGANHRTQASAESRVQRATESRRLARRLGALATLTAPLPLSNQPPDALHAAPSLVLEPALLSQPDTAPRADASSACALLGSCCSRHGLPDRLLRR